MAKPIEILCVLDRSGSMGSIMDEAIAAFNHFVEQQKQLPGKAKLTLAAFDDRYELILKRVKISDVPSLNRSAVEPRGMTALYDAIGRTISSAKTDRQTICLIQTDGYENASQEYSAKQIKELIKQKEGDGWEFVFIGAGVDAFTAGTDFGLTADKCVSVAKSSVGMEAFAYELGSRTTSFRRSKS
ncbi:vWA domain-containing protein [Motiliproteus sp. SC1-56]|uniref:vWA domain-containing protein n=1 Tax=Motiliproteus sp. SC1-56 TaxID=2799565 RepID=UPI001A9065FD|nr:vWA domain-containing protein [Motiliproteus sp. SC1-56]